MYYLKLGITAVAILAAAISLMIDIVSSINVALKRTDSRTAIKKAFVLTFTVWFSMSFVYLLWVNKTDWAIVHYMLFIAFATVSSFVIASISAFGLWNWKR